MGLSVRLSLKVLGDSASCERFVVLRVLINSVVPVGRALISPSTLLMAGDEAIAKARLVGTKIMEYHMQRKGML